MSHLLDDDDDDLHGHQNHRELTLSPSAIMGIFFALALSWALFFGFGYNMGNRSKLAASITPTDSTDNNASTPNFNSFKPSPGSPTGSPSGVSSVPVNSGSGPVTTIPPAATSHAAPDTSEDAPTTPAKSTPAPAPIALHAAQPTAAPPQPSSSASTATGSFVVQIAAVSHQEDADLLVGALRGKGYSVIAHTEPDKLVHIQVGPFNNHKDADAMRQRLLADGYNAIVK
jgi:DedD protein